MKKWLFAFVIAISFMIMPLSSKALDTGAYTYDIYSTDDVIYTGGNTTVTANWWGTDTYWEANTTPSHSSLYMGYTWQDGQGGFHKNNRFDFRISNANLCVDHDISISGYIGALFDYFNENLYDITIKNHNEEMTCVYEIEETGSRLKFSCVGKGGGDFYIQVKTTNFYSPTKTYQMGISKTLEVSCDSSNADIINQSINNTNAIINNQNQNTQDIINNQNTNNTTIINNQNQNTQDIINNQNANTEREIEENRKNFEECRDSINLLPKPTTKVHNGITWTVNDDGSITVNGTATKSSYIDLYYSENSNLIEGNEIYTIYKGINNNLFYVSVFEMLNNSWSLVGGSANGYGYAYSPSGNSTGQVMRITVNSGVTLNNVTLYPMVLAGNYSTSFIAFEPYGKQICTNRIDKTNEQLNNLNNNIIDDTPPDTNGLGNVAGWLPAGPVDSLINLPLSMLNSMTFALGQSCQPLTLPLPYVNQNMELPCLSSVYSKIDGVGEVFDFISYSAGAFILYYYFKNLYQWVNNKVSLKEDESWGGI